MEELNECGSGGNTGAGETYCRRDLSACCSVDMTGTPWFFCEGEWLLTGIITPCEYDGHISKRKPGETCPTGEVMCVTTEYSEILTEKVKSCPSITNFCVSDEDCRYHCREMVEWTWKCCHAERSYVTCEYETEKEYLEALETCETALCNKRFSNGLLCD